MTQDRAGWALPQDLDVIVDLAREDLLELDGNQLFMTGGTGFIGCWFLETLHHAESRLGLRLRTTILTRGIELFRTKAPHLAGNPSFTFVNGNIIDFDFPDGEFTHIIHAAADASAKLNAEDPLRMFDTVTTGTNRALQFAIARKAKRFLQLSSGAVYGLQPPEVDHIDEAWMGAPDCQAPVNAYAEAKRAAEMLCAIHAKQFGLEISIARIFAVLGPYQTLDAHFAAGNFINDAIHGRPIVVNSDGRASRSYLYAGDLVVWLLRLLARGKPGRAYNVGSDEAVTIGELAARVAALIGNGDYTILGAPDLGWNPGRYTPSTNAIERDLGVARTVSLDEAIRRTAIWNGWTGCR
ncbi:MAG: NAD-dependent epimerase/dehydratase family protein [Methylocystis sp.]